VITLQHFKTLLLVLKFYFQKTKIIVLLKHLRKM